MTEKKKVLPTQAHTPLFIYLLSFSVSHLYFNKMFKCLCITGHSNTQQAHYIICYIILHVMCYMLYIMLLYIKSGFQLQAICLFCRHSEVDTYNSSLWNILGRLTYGAEPPEILHEKTQCGRPGSDEGESTDNPYIRPFVFILHQ